MSYYGQHPDDMDYYPQTESQMCLEEARLKTASDNAQAWDLINDLLARGRFIVVFFHPAYCRATDALCGEYLNAQTSWDTRAEAEAYVASLGRDEITSFDPETRVEIWPKLPPPPVQLEMDLDNVPF